jgi:hypothetical protein
MRGRAENCSTDYLTLQHHDHDDDQEVEARAATTTNIITSAKGSCDLTRNPTAASLKYFILFRSISLKFFSKY